MIPFSYLAKVGSMNTVTEAAQRSQQVSRDKLLKTTKSQGVSTASLYSSSTIALSPLFCKLTSFARELRNGHTNNYLSGLYKVYKAMLRGIIEAGVPQVNMTVKQLVDLENFGDVDSTAVLTKQKKRMQ